MPAGQVVVLPSVGQRGYQDDRLDLFRQQMIMDSLNALGGTVAGVMANYERSKQEKRNEQIAGFKMAAELAGGADLLPQEALANFETAIGVKLPRDEAGMIKITPSAEALADRHLSELIKKDPDGTVKILKGLQNPEPSPVMVDIENRKMELTERLSNADNAVRMAIARMSEAGANHRAALSRAAAAEEAGALDKPSNFLSLEDGRVVDTLQYNKMVQEMGQSIPARPITLREAGMSLQLQKQQSEVEAGAAQMEWLNSKIEMNNLKAEQLLAKNPYIGEMLRAASNFRMLGDDASSTQILEQLKKDWIASGALQDDPETGWLIDDWLMKMVEQGIGMFRQDGGMSTPPPSPTTTTLVPPTSGPASADANVIVLPSGKKIRVTP